MSVQKNHRQGILSAIILLGGGAAAAAIFASSALAQTAAGVMFPIPELGNCASEGACRAYCDDATHIEACVSFAQAHGLMNKDDSERAKKFSELLASSETPGNCTNEAECQSFCSDMSHMDVCISFAKKLGIHDDHLAQGEKILAYLKSGGTMPGGCTSKERCEAYCGSADHSDECVAFLEHSGLGVPPDAVGPDGKPMTFDELKKVMALMKSGEAPGGCKSKDECRSYCEDSSHINSCAAFAVKAGFITQEQADLAEKTGGKGPGGCSSEDSCKAYCDDTSHQQECFDFAKEHGLIPAEKLQEMQQGVERLKMGLKQAPPEVLSCLKSTVGENALNEILAGTLLPGPNIGDHIQSCFEKFAGEMQRGNPSMQDTWDSFPPAIQSCLTQSLGADRIKGILAGNGTEADATAVPEAIRACMQSVAIPRE